MSYIDKNGNVVISARMTDKGREKLSVGELNFNTFKLGDSEVDYSSLGSTYDVTLENVLRSKACQPRAKTWLLKDINSPSGSVVIPPLTPLEIGNVIESPEKGFFDIGSTGTTINSSLGALTDDEYSLNEAAINVSDLDGTNVIQINSNSQTTSYEPMVGDIIMIKYDNPNLTETLTSYTVDLTIPVPYLFYKIQSKSGSIANNSLEVTLDRDLPDFSSYSGSKVCDVIFYPNNGSTDFSNGLYRSGTIWNMNNVWSEDMAGVNEFNYESFKGYGSENYIGTKEFFGYTSTLTGSCETNKAISIIHYTNTEDCERQSELVYGQKLHIDLNLDEKPVLRMPTLMWHRASGDNIGQSFTAYGTEKYVQERDGFTTDIRYFDLVDEQGFEVGRVFPDQHIFTLDDDELVAAMSYKSNRNWTLPKLNLGLKSSNDGLVDNTDELHVTYLFNNTSSGFTTGLHNQYHSCITVSEVVDKEGNSCGDGQTKDIEVTFPMSQLPYMKNDGTGWYADEFIILVQKVVEGEYPNPNEWYAIDFTSEINNGTHVVGDKIDPLDLEASTFVITKSLYDTAKANSDRYEIHDYINIPTTSETDVLQFGDENFFYGNVTSSGITNKYRTKFNFVVPPTQWNTSNNPTWKDSGQNPHISEVIIQDRDGNVVAVGKENLPIEKTNNTTIIIEIAFDM